MTWSLLPEDSTKEREPREPEGDAAQVTPETAVTSTGEPATDVKIRELEGQLDQLRQLKAGEQTERLREIQAETSELEERQREREQYAELAPTGEPKAATPTEAAPAAEPARAAAVGQITAAKLLGDDPQDAVAKLVALASSGTNGFENAIKLSKEIAPLPGGAWILDEFHKRMTQKGAGGAKGRAPGQ